MATTASQSQTLARVDQEQLREALRSVELAVSTAAPFVHLSSTASRLELRTFGNYIHLRVRLPLDDVEAGLKATVAPAELKRALGAFAKEDVLELSQGEGEGLVIAHGRRRVSLPEVSEAVPVWPSLRGKRAVADSTDPSQLARDFELAMRTAHDEQFRPVLCSVLIDFDEGVLVSTDSYRLQRRSAPLRAAGEEAGDVVIPRDAAKVLAKDLRRRTNKVVFAATREWLSVSQGPMELVVRPVEGQYPDWRKLLADAPERGLSVEREALAESLRAVEAIASSSSSRSREREPVRVILDSDGISLRFRSLRDATLEEELSAEGWTGDPVEAGFQPHFLLDAIKVLDDERIEIRVKDALRPILVAGEQAVVLQMPVRLPS